MISFENMLYQRGENPPHFSSVEDVERRNPRFQEGVLMPGPRPMTVRDVVFGFVALIQTVFSGRAFCALVLVLLACWLSRWQYDYHGESRIRVNRFSGWTEKRVSLTDGVVQWVPFDRIEGLAPARTGGPFSR